MNVNIQVSKSQRIEQILNESIMGNMAICYHCSSNTAEGDQPLSAQFPLFRVFSKGAYIAGRGTGCMYGYGVYTMERFRDNVQGGYGGVIYQVLIRDISKFLVFDKQTFYHLYKHFNLYADDVKGVLAKGLQHFNNYKFNYVLAQLVYHKLFPTFDSIPLELINWLKYYYDENYSGRLALSTMDFMSCYSKNLIGTSSFWNNQTVLGGHKSNTHKEVTDSPFTKNNWGKGVHGVIYKGGQDELCVLPFHYIAATVIRAAKVEYAQNACVEWLIHTGKVSPNDATYSYYTVAMNESAFPKEPLWDDFDPKFVNELTYKGKKIWHTGEEVVPNYNKKIRRYLELYSQQHSDEDHIHVLMNMMRFHDLAGEYRDMSYDLKNSSSDDLYDTIQHWTGTIPKELVAMVRKEQQTTGDVDWRKAVYDYQTLMLNRIRAYCNSPTLKLTHEDRFEVDSEIVFKWLIQNNLTDCVDRLLELGLNPNIHHGTSWDRSDWGKEANWEWLTSKVDDRTAQELRDKFLAASDPSNIDSTWADRIKEIVTRGSDAHVDELATLIEENRGESSELLEIYIQCGDRECNLLEYAWMRGDFKICEVLKSIGLQIRNDVIIPLIVSLRTISPNDRIDHLKALDLGDKILDFQILVNYTYSGTPIHISLGSYLLGTSNNTDMAPYATAFPAIKNRKYLPEFLFYLYEAVVFNTETDPYYRAAKQIAYLKQKRNENPRKYLPHNISIKTFLRVIYNKLRSNIGENTARDVFNGFVEAFKFQNTSGISDNDLGLAEIRTLLSQYAESGGLALHDGNIIDHVEPVIKQDPKLLEFPDVVTGWSYMATIWRFMDDANLEIITDNLNKGQVERGLDLINLLNFNQMRAALHVKSKNGQSAVNILRSRGDRGIRALRALNKFYEKDGELTDLSDLGSINYAEELAQRQQANKPKIRIRKAWDKAVDNTPPATPPPADANAQPNDAAPADEEVSECLKILQLY